MPRALLIRLSLLILLLAPTSFTATKRAVLIGINNYIPSLERRAAIEKVPVAHTFKRPAVPGGWIRATFPNLAGPVADAELMKSLLAGMGFNANDVITLYDQQATADAILSTLYRQLVTDANRGDVRFVFYAGHGGTARNRATGDDDQTIVPADHWRDVPDIRDKEVSRILFEAGRKGVIVTMVADSCHSGSLSRGTWNDVGTPRSAPVTSPVIVDDPPSIDPVTHKPIDPTTVGVLYFSATQRNEEALEYQVASGPGGAVEIHGAFTWALRQALVQGSGRADLIYQRTLAFLRADGKAQQPVLEASPERKAMSLAGESVSGIHGLVVTADSALGRLVNLRAGSALGIYEGSEFSRIDNQKPPMRIRVTKVVSPAESEAAVIEPPAGVAARGDQFQLEKFVCPPASALRLFVPKAATLAAIDGLGVEMAKLASAGVTVVSDALAGRPTHVITWDGTKWQLETHPAIGPLVALGPSPTADTIRRSLPATARVLIIYPPTAGLLVSLQRTAGANPTVLPSSSPKGSHYLLEGRLQKGVVEYAWIQPDAVESLSDTSPLPIRSDWIPSGVTPSETQRAGDLLADKAFRIARVRAWLTLPAPPNPGSAAFPYHLALQDVATRDVVSAGKLKGGTRFKVMLRASEADLKATNYIVMPRFLYVFVVDQNGAGSLIYPRASHGNEANRLPAGTNARDQAAPVDVREQVSNGQHLTTVSPPEAPFDFEVTEPFGTDTYMLLTSEQPITNLEVFEFAGARTGESRGISTDALTELLAGVGSSQTRGPRPVPSSWMIERLVFRSIP